MAHYIFRVSEIFIKYLTGGRKACRNGVKLLGTFTWVVSFSVGLIPLAARSQSLPNLTHGLKHNFNETIRPIFFKASHHKHSFLPQKILYRPRIGLALSGGGSRSISQIGVLQVLQENGIPIDFIVGTSMGSIIGGLFAAGYSPYELEKIFKSIKWKNILIDRPPRRSLFFGNKQKQDRLLFQVRLDGFKPYIPPALTPGQKLQSLLTELTMNAKYASSTHFDDFRIPFRAVSTDLSSGQKVVIAKGDLAEAMRASLAFPLLISPVPLNGKLLVDGGLIDNIPVDEVKKFPVDLVIAVDATSKLRKGDQLVAPWEIADQVTSIMQRGRNAESRKKADILIRIEDPDRTSTDFTQLDSLIQIGRNVALQHLGEIQDKIENIQRKIYQDFPNRRYIVERILIKPESLRSRIQKFAQLNGHAVLLSAKDILNILESIYREGSFQDIYAKITPQLNGVVLRIHAKKNPVLKKIVFAGNTVFPDDTLRNIVKPLIDKPLNPQKTQKVLEQLISRYRQEGYSLTRIARTDFDEKQGVGILTLDEGRIRSISIEGNKRTRAHVIKREFSLKPGDIFNFIKAQKGIDNIFGTGLFYRAGISITRQANSIDLIIKLQEKKYNAIGISFRSDTERKTRGFLEFSDENFMGLGAQLALQTEYGSRDKSLQAKFSIDRIFKTYLTLNVQAYLNKTRNLVYRHDERFPIGEYTQRQLGSYISVGQLMRKLGIVSIELHTDRYRIDPVSGNGYPVDTFLLNRLTLRSIVDTRDHLPYPSRGRYVQFFYDFSNKRLKSDRSFFRIFLSIETFNTIAKRHTINPRFMFGTSDLTTPYPMHFRISGPDQFFGLRDQEWTGRHFFIFNFNYRYFFPWKILFRTYLGTRLDMGGVWQSPEDTNYKRLHQAIGLYLGLDTLLGAIEISYGRLDTGQRRFYLTMGYKF